MAIINKGMSRRSFLGLTGSVAAVAGLGLTGCGGSSSDEGSASGSTDSVNRGGGVITAGSAYAPSSFDPASTGSAVGLGANWHVVEGLYGIDYHDYSTFNELATDDPKSVDDTTFEVTIRKGAKFSDGTEVTADDVVASYTACAASATYAPFFQPFESIEAKDASTVTVKTKVPNFSLLKDRLAIVRVTPATQTEEDRAKQPIGSGPWMYDSISDTEITLVPNPEYNGEYAAEDKKIQYSILTDPTARVTAQQEGSTLVMELVTADAVDQLESAGCKIDNVQGFGTRFIMFNVAKDLGTTSRSVRLSCMRSTPRRWSATPSPALPPLPAATCPRASPTIMRLPRCTRPTPRRLRSSSRSLASPRVPSPCAPPTTSRLRAWPPRSRTTSTLSASM